VQQIDIGWMDFDLYIIIVREKKILYSRFYFAFFRKEFIFFLSYFVFRSFFDLHPTFLKNDNLLRHMPFPFG